MQCVTVQDPQLVRLADAICSKVGAQRFNLWFDRTTRLTLKQECLDIVVPNDFISEWIGRHFSKPIEEATHEVLGSALAVRFVVMPQMFEAGQSGSQEQSHSSQHSKPDAAASNRSQDRQAATNVTIQADHGLTKRTVGTQHIRSGLPNAKPDHVSGSDVEASLRAESKGGMSLHGPRNVSLGGGRGDFASFVIGPNNEMACRAALHVAEHPARSYNPLFIHGNCGLGKTHLLMAVCKHFMQTHPGKRFAYLTGEEFTNDFVTAIRGGRLEAFRRRMRDVELLVIDDVHFLAGKKATQEEFLHTFNAVEASGRQLVMASDAHPKLIGTFTDSLINRFVSGFVVKVDPPALQTRCDILRHLARRGGMTLPEDVVQWVAKRVTQNVRELEGALTRLWACADLTGQKVDLAVAQVALQDLDKSLSQPLRHDAIVRAVCQFFGLEEQQLKSGGRQRTISLARSMAMYLIRKSTTLSYPEIGNKLGDRNHSTVISACKRVEESITQHEQLTWTTCTGTASSEAKDLVERLVELARTAA